MFKPYAANYGITRDDREIIFLSLSLSLFFFIVIIVIIRGTIEL